MTDDHEILADAPIIVLDFDGVIHSYTSGWRGVNTILDPPTDGAVEAVNAYLDAGYQAAVLSSRSHHPGGIEAMKAWMRQSPSTTGDGGLKASGRASARSGDSNRGIGRRFSDKL